MLLVFFRKQHWNIDFFHDMQQSDLLNITDNIHFEALWFCFADLLQNHLDDVKEFWNTHRIRKSKYSVAHGTLNVIFSLSEEYGRVNCLHPIYPNKLCEMRTQLDHITDHGDVNGEGSVDPIWENYFQYVVEQNGLMYPITPLEGKNHFEILCVLMGINWEHIPLLQWLEISYNTILLFWSLIYNLKCKSLKVKDFVWSKCYDKKEVDFKKGQQNSFLLICCNSIQLHFSQSCALFFRFWQSHRTFMNFYELKIYRSKVYAVGAYI